MKARVEIMPLGMLLGWGSVCLLAVGVAKFSGPPMLLGVLGFLGLWLSRRVAIQNLSAPGLRLIRQWPQHGYSGERFSGMTTLISGEVERHEIEVMDQMKALETALVRFDLVDGKSQKTEWCRVLGRGKVEASEARLRSTYPLRIWSVASTRQFERGEGTMVWPRPMLPGRLEQRLENVIADRLAEERLAAVGGGDSFDLHGMRPFRGGDPVKLIHWPASSRGQGLMVREFDRPGSYVRKLGILAQSYAAPGEILRPDRFEQMLRLTCGVLRWGAKRELDLEVAFLFETPQDSLLNQLALAARREVTPTELAGTLERLESTCDVVLVIGQTPEALPMGPSTVCVGANGMIGNA